MRINVKLDGVLYDLEVMAEIIANELTFIVEDNTGNDGGRGDSLESALNNWKINKTAIS